MKIYANRCEQEYMFEIIIQFEEADAEISAKAYVEDPENIARKFRHTDEQLKVINNFIGSVFRIIYRHKFLLLEDWQSEDSCSYYIRFLATDVDGHVFEHRAPVKFKLTDHIKRRKRYRAYSLSEEELFVSFVLHNTTYHSVEDALAEVEDMCSRLERDDYSMFIKK